MAKPYNERLAVVSATLGVEGAEECFASWRNHATYQLSSYYVSGKQGVVPSFAAGVRIAFANGAEAVCTFHDDLRIDQPGWDVVVQDALDSGVKFAGFGGSPSLGSDQLYKFPYDPMQLARGRFLSNMQDAEAHGERVTVQTPCVVFDGFSQIGTKDWFEAAWQWLGASGIVHHYYDGCLASLAARAGVQPGVMLPVKCHHFGGRTAVGSAAYQDWARTQTPDGDQGFWEAAHRIGYEAFRDALPLRVEQFR